MLGWTERPADFMEWKIRETPAYLAKYRVIERHDSIVGYVRTSPRRPASMDEVVAPAAGDFRAAVGLCEASRAHGFASVSWITAEEDARKFRRLGYTIDGPIGDVTMAVSLSHDIANPSLPGLFGGRSGRFVHYPTDDF
jgi:hypothetical protein